MQNRHTLLVGNKLLIWRELSVKMDAGRKCLLFWHVWETLLRDRWRQCCIAFPRPRLTTELRYSSLVMSERKGWAALSLPSCSSLGKSRSGFIPMEGMPILHTLPPK